jgi:predicted Zn-ribbon and HTH transcriptional regulator
MIILRMIELNSMIPHYWSELFLLSKQLFTEPEEELMLEMFVRTLEEDVLEREYIYNKFICKKCEYKFMTRQDWFEIQQCPKCSSSDVRLVYERMSLYDIEMALESNQDYNSYMRRYGVKISKFDIERRLNTIKEWIYGKVREKSVGRRFKRFK